MRFHASFRHFSPCPRCALAGPARPLERSEVPARYQWDLKDLYVDEAAWVAGKQELVQSLPALGAWQGKLGASAASLLRRDDGLGAGQPAGRPALRIRLPALRPGHPRGAQPADAAGDVAGLFELPVGHVVHAARDPRARPRADRCATWPAEPKLGQYRMYLRRHPARGAAHADAGRGEDRRAQAGADGEAGGTLQSVFTSADLPFPEVTLSTGEKVRLDAAAYTKYRASPNKADRDARVQGVLDALQRVHAHVRDHAERARAGARLRPRTCASSDLARGRAVRLQHPARPSTRSCSPTSTPTCRRCTATCGCASGSWALQQLGYEDLYAPIVQQVDLRYTPEQAHAADARCVRAARHRRTSTRCARATPTAGSTSCRPPARARRLQQHGLRRAPVPAAELQRRLRRRLDAGPRVRPLDALVPVDRRTSRTRPSDYSIFVAEVASTLNENLLLHHMLDQTKDDRTRLFLLSSYLDSLRTTLFRQTLFAEFELQDPRDGRARRAADRRDT